MDLAIFRTEKGFIKTWRIPNFPAPFVSTVSLNPVKRMTGISDRIRRSSSARLVTQPLLDLAPIRWVDLAVLITNDT